MYVNVEEKLPEADTKSGFGPSRSFDVLTLHFAWSKRLSTPAGLVIHDTLRKRHTGPEDAPALNWISGASGPPSAAFHPPANNTNFLATLDILRDG